VNFQNNNDSSFFKTLVALSSESIIISDIQGAIVYLNYQAAQLFQYTQDDLLGKKIEILIPSASRKEHVKLRKSYDKAPANRPHGKGLDVYALKSNGQTFPAEISLTSIHFEENIYTVSIVSDITSRKEREQKIQNFIIEQQEAKRAYVQSKLEVLKNQISPHYLFNCLSVLYPMIDSNPKTAMTFTKKLAETYGYVLETKNKREISLVDEVNFLKNYVFLQKIRFGDTFQLKIQKEVELDTRTILPLSIQTLIENVFKHNRLSKNKPLEISITLVGSGLLVSNTVTEGKYDLKSYGIGLSNLVKQYELISERKPKIDRNDKVFSVWLPLFENKSK